MDYYDEPGRDISDRYCIPARHAILGGLDRASPRAHRAGVAELADAGDSKSPGALPLVGSIPSSGTNTLRDIVITRTLSFHASYQCAHSGACCRARWPIPVEPKAAAALATAFPDGPSVLPASRIAPALLPRTAVSCAFHDLARHRCLAHEAIGHEALPLACHQFPRITINGPDCDTITLSCVCPTARRLMETWTGVVSVVENGPGFPPTGRYVGLDARTSLPPALTPDVLMDWASWHEWERRTVDACNADLSPTGLMAHLSEVVERTRTWRPGHGALREQIARNFERVLPVSPASRLHPVNRFVACWAFANWTGVLGGGLRSWLRSLDTVVWLVEDQGWPFEDVDLWLRHYADPYQLAAVWARAESAPVRGTGAS